MTRDVNNIILHKNDSILKALELLDLYALRIVLVVDDHNQLIGSITDGDIRRGLLKAKMCMQLLKQSCILTLIVLKKVA